MTFDIFAFKEGELYGSEIPQTEDDFQILKKLGIKIIISLTNEIREVKRRIAGFNDFEHYEIFINDFYTPSKEQVEEFLKIIEKNRLEKKAIVVHCYAGCGRTGLMLALAERFVYGVEDASEAITNVRNVRPCAVENSKQKEYIIDFQR